jgi:hypothetical protein
MPPEVRAASRDGSAQVALTLHLPEGPRRHIVTVRELVIAGWTGRDPAAVEAHIRELEALGVTRPDRIPTFYPVPASLLTTDPGIHVTGHDSTGEVEVVLMDVAGELWVTVGSDHTDRTLETVSVLRSKEACPKPLATEAWRLCDIEPHWDELVLRAHIASAAEGSALYQEGRVATLRAPRELVTLHGEHRGRPFGPSAAMFCGTFAVRGGLRWADRFTIELEDPVLNRRIVHSYDVADALAASTTRAD